MNAQVGQNVEAMLLSVDGTTSLSDTSMEKVAMPRWEGRQVKKAKRGGASGRRRSRRLIEKRAKEEGQAVEGNLGGAKGQERYQQRLVKETIQLTSIFPREVKTFFFEGLIEEFVRRLHKLKRI